MITYHKFEQLEHGIMTTLRIDTSLAVDNLEPTSPDALSVTTPTARQRTVSLSHGILPNIRRSSAEKTSFGSQNSEAHQGALKARQESRKPRAGTSPSGLLFMQMVPPVMMINTRDSGSAVGSSGVLALDAIVYH